MATRLLSHGKCTHAVYTLTLPHSCDAHIPLPHPPHPLSHLPTTPPSHSPTTPPSPTYHTPPLTHLSHPPSHPPTTHTLPSLRGDYVLPDPPHYLEDCVWPEYEKQKKELENDASVSKHKRNNTSLLYQQCSLICSSCAEFLDGGSSLKFLVQEAEAFVRSCMQQLTATDHPAS